MQNNFRCNSIPKVGQFMNFGEWSFRIGSHAARSHSMKRVVVKSPAEYTNFPFCLAFGPPFSPAYAFSQRKQNTIVFT